jgi:hypothetical protein
MFLKDEASSRKHHHYLLDEFLAQRTKNGMTKDSS